MNLTEKLLARHAVGGREGPYLQLRVDRVAMQDVSGQMVLLQLLSSPIERVAVPAALHCDHLITATSGAAGDVARALDANAEIYDFLAEHERTARVTTAEIGREQQIPLTFLAKIVAQLSTAGILRSTRGSHGGVCLAMPPEEISLLDIVEVIDGPIELNECVADRSLCALGDNCPVRTVWCNAQAELVDRLMRTNFGVLAALHHKAEPIFEPA